MTNIINVSKGLDIRIDGEADKSLMASTYKVADFAVKPTDFYGVTPKMMVEEGAEVKAGTPLFYSKQDERIRFVSPVSGVVSEIRRGEKRRILEVRIKADEQQRYETFEVSGWATMSPQAIKDIMLQSGLWPMLRQRPYHVIAKPEDQPKAIVVSAFDTAPMAPDYDFIVHDKQEAFQCGIDILCKLTSGALHLNLHRVHTHSKVFSECKNAQIHYFSGKHPVGNVGVQIHHLDPINKGESVWFVNPQDVVIIGTLFMEGKLDATKIVALAGSELNRTGYHRIISGACIKPLVEQNLIDGAHSRFISGNVLSGTQIEMDGYLGFYDHLISVIPEGDQYELFGWATPGFNKFSFWRAFFSWMMPSKRYVLNTNLHGGHRALIFTGKFEQVLPMDIYPLQLIKACLAEDIEAMEALGIYEVAPEDLALCEFIDPSKTDIQKIIQDGLDLIRKEMN